MAVKTWDKNANLLSLLEEIVQGSKLINVHTDLVHKTALIYSTGSELVISIPSTFLFEAVVDKLVSDHSKFKRYINSFLGWLHFVLHLLAETGVNPQCIIANILSHSEKLTKAKKELLWHLENRTLSYSDPNLCYISMLRFFAHSGVTAGLSYQHESEVFSVQGTVSTASERVRSGKYMNMFWLFPGLGTFAAALCSLHSSTFTNSSWLDHHKFSDDTKLFSSAPPADFNLIAKKTEQL